MATKHKPAASPHDVKVPPVPKPRPPGASYSSAMPQGIERQAQELVHEAGSVGKAKKAIDSADEMENASDFREDQLALSWGFASRKEMLAASKPIRDRDGASWWATRIPEGRWIVWNQETIKGITCLSLEEAKQSLVAHKPDDEPSSPPAIPDVFIG